MEDYPYCSKNKLEVLCLLRDKVVWFVSMAFVFDAVNLEQNDGYDSNYYTRLKWNLRRGSLFVALDWMR